MALAISTVPSFRDSGQEYNGVINLAGSSTYTAGGDTVSWKHIQIKTAKKPFFGHGFASNGAMATYDVANDKVKLWNGTTEFVGSLVGVTVTLQTLFPKA